MEKTKRAFRVYAEVTGFEPIRHEVKARCSTVELHLIISEVWLNRTTVCDFGDRCSATKLSPRISRLGLTDSNHHSPVQSRAYCHCTKSQRGSPSWSRTNALAVNSRPLLPLSYRRSLASQTGYDPVTFSFSVRRSTAELPGNTRHVCNCSAI